MDYAELNAACAAIDQYIATLRYKPSKVSMTIPDSCAKPEFGINHNGNSTEFRVQFQFYKETGTVHPTYKSTVTNKTKSCRRLVNMPLCYKVAIVKQWHLLKESLFAWTAIGYGEDITEKSYKDSDGRNFTQRKFADAEEWGDMLSLPEFVL